MLITNCNYMYGTVYDNIHKMALQLKIGDSISFGAFAPQIEGREMDIRFPILWHVIDRKENKLKLLSYFFFDHTGYWSVDGGRKPVTWENTEIREKLNNKIFHDCFNDDEQKAILITDVKTKKNNSEYIVTQDKLYVPSLEEIQHIPEHLKMGRTLFPEIGENGKLFMTLMYCFYWLRDPGENKNENLIVQGYANSKLVLDSIQHNSDEVGVRAVMWIDAEKIHEFSF